MPPRRKSASRRPWNKGLAVGQKDAFTPVQVKRIRRLLVDRGAAGLRDLALFSIAIDTMLNGQDLLDLVVGDLQQRNGSIRSVFEVARAKGRLPVRCVLSKVTTTALERWINTTRKKRTDYLFPSRRFKNQPMTPRQLNRLLKEWVTEAGLDPAVYGGESLRRTKALHILKRSGDLHAVRALLGHVKIESTARYLGPETESDPIEICRAFHI
jgi:integrase